MRTFWVFVHRIECQRPENNLAGAKQPGDEAMQATIDFWEKHQPDSALEVLEIGRQEGIEEGIEKGIEEGKQQMAIEMARRLIENGSSDTEVEKYTDLSLVAIRKLRNGGVRTFWVLSIANNARDQKFNPAGLTAGR